jgi:hypothetical protein
LGIMSVILAGCALGSYIVLGPGKDLVFKVIAESWPSAGWVTGPEQIASLDRIRVPSLTAMVMVAAFSGGALMALLRSRPRMAYSLLAAMMVPLFVFVHYGFLVMEPFMSTRPVAELVQRSAGPEDLVIVREPAEYMWIGGITYYTKRMVYILKRPDYDLLPAQRREPADRFLDREGLAALWKSGKRVLLIADADVASDLRPLLSGVGPVEVIGRCVRLLVLGNSENAK